MIKRSQAFTRLCQLQGLALCTQHCLSQLEHDLICLTTTTQLVALLCLSVRKARRWAAFSRSPFARLCHSKVASGWLTLPCHWSPVRHLKNDLFFLSIFPVDIFTTSDQSLLIFLPYCLLFPLSERVVRFAKSHSLNSCSRAVSHTLKEPSSLKFQNNLILKIVGKCKFLNLT